MTAEINPAHISTFLPITGLDGDGETHRTARGIKSASARTEEQLLGGPLQRQESCVLANKVSTTESSKKDYRSPRSQWAVLDYREQAGEEEYSDKEGHEGGTYQGPYLDDHISIIV
jgi:hypothetical protein